jgi:hypothetical protein
MTLVDLIDTDERRLWTAIVAQVVRDLFSPDSLLTPVERTRALRWLTEPSGDLARDRRIACAFAGQDGDVLRERVISILNGAPPPPFESFRGARNLAITVEEARAMWRAQATQPSLKPRLARKPAQPAPVPKPVHAPERSPAPSKRRLTAVPPTVLPMPDDTAPLTIPDDPFFPTLGKHMRASRPWIDGEVSRFLGPLPSFHSKVGRVLWEITQQSSVGRNAVSIIGDVDALIAELAAALPTCDVCWTAKGERFATYRPNAALRLYLKSPTSTSNARSDALSADVTL